MYNIPYKHQYGLKKSHSAFMALLHLVDKIHTALEKNIYIYIIFLDLCKAFYTVNHYILHKLQKYGFHGYNYKNQTLIQSGVPQGTIIIISGLYKQSCISVKHCMSNINCKSYKFTCIQQRFVDTHERSKQPPCILKMA